MGRSETDIFVGKPEARKKLGRPLWDRRITTKMNFDVKVCQGFYWVQVGFQSGVLLKSAMCFGFHTKMRSISGLATRKKGACMRPLRWR